MYVNSALFYQQDRILVGGNALFTSLLVIFVSCMHVHAFMKLWLSRFSAIINVWFYIFLLNYTRLFIIYLDCLDKIAAEAFLLNARYFQVLHQ
jgi:hypothetical protein